MSAAPGHRALDCPGHRLAVNYGCQAVRTLALVPGIDRKLARLQPTRPTLSAGEHLDGLLEIEPPERSTTRPPQRCSCIYIGCGMSARRTGRSTAASRGSQLHLYPNVFEQGQRRRKPKPVGFFHHKPGARNPSGDDLAFNARELADACVPRNWRHVTKRCRL